LPGGKIIVTMPNDYTDDDLVLLESLDKSYKSRKATILATAASGFIGLYLGMENGFSYFTITWFSLLLVYIFATYLLVQRFLATPPAGRNPGFWQNMFLLSVCGLGLFWVSLAVFLELYGPQTSQFIVLIIIAYFATGAYATYAYLKHAGTVFSFIIFPPIIALNLYQGQSHDIVLAVTVFIYFVFLQIGGAHLHTQLTETIKTSIRNKELAAKLESANAKLECEMIATLEAKSKAEDATRLKDQFVSLVSHDLKSPLSGIVVALQAMQEPEKHGLDQFTRQDILKALYDSSKNLYDFVERLLDVSRLQTGSITPRKNILNTRPFLEGVISRFLPLAHQKDIQIINSIPEDHKLFADEGLLGEVVSNLLSNALKFCSKSDSIRFFQPEGFPGCISVSDTGPGVRPEFVDNLFLHQFKTTSPGSLGEIGSGLGLPHSADIIRAHNGSLSVDTSQVQGATFVINLPYPERFVLIADDQPAHLDIMKECARRVDERAGVIQVESGAQALAICQKQTLDLIITDLNMPGMSGFDLIKRIRMSPQNGAAPIIAVSSLDWLDPEAQRRAKLQVMETGANDFVGKPINSQSFEVLLSRYLKISSPAQA